MSKLTPIDVDFKMEAYLLINTREKNGGEFKGTVLLLFDKNQGLYDSVQKEML